MIGTKHTCRSKFIKYEINSIAYADTPRAQNVFTISKKSSQNTAIH